MSNRPGRPRSIDLSKYRCPNPQCPDARTNRHNLVSRGTYRTKANQERRIITCCTCNFTFSSSYAEGDTHYLDRKTIGRAMHLLTKGMPIRVVAQTLDVAPKTISTWLHRTATDMRWMLEILAKTPRINMLEFEALLASVREGHLRQRSAQWTRQAHADPTFTRRIANQIALETLAARRPRLRSRLHR